MQSKPAKKDYQSPHIQSFTMETEGVLLSVSKFSDKQGITLSTSDVSPSAPSPWSSEE